MFGLTRLIRAFSISILLLLSASPAVADITGNSAWTSIGPEGGTILSLAIDPKTPSTLYVSTSAGVFKSVNGGESWNPAGTGLPVDASVSALAIDPLKPATLYAGTSGGGVYKSTDGGISWQVSSNGLAALNISCLAIDPLTPATIYAGAYGGVFKSLDGGESWSPISNGLSGSYDYPDIKAIVINTATPAILYVGTKTGLLKSSDGGGNWQVENIDIIQFEANNLAIDPITPSTLYAAVSYVCHIGKLFASCLGVIKSTDGGESWQFSDAGLPKYNVSIGALAIDSLAPTTLYAGTGNGVFVSINGGVSWQEFNSGLTNTDISVLAISRLMPADIYAGTNGGGAFKRDAVIVHRFFLPALNH